MLAASNLSLFTPVGSISYLLSVSILGPNCEDVAFTVAEGEPGRVTFTPEEPGTYHLRVGHAGVGTSLQPPYLGPNTQTSHCAPFCATTYELAAS